MTVSIPETPTGRGRRRVRRIRARGPRVTLGASESELGLFCDRCGRWFVAERLRVECGACGLGTSTWISSIHSPGEIAFGVAFSRRAPTRSVVHP